MGHVKQFLVFFLTAFSLSSARLIRRRKSPVAQTGPYKVRKFDYDLSGILDDTNTEAVVVVPEKALQEGNTETFPLLVFAHGFTGGNFLTYRIHRALLEGVASFGYIVIAPKSCAFGCPGFGRWGTYYEEQLKVIEWASNPSRPEDTEGILRFVDRDAGYGVFGHSIGGQATARSLAFADQYDIKAGVLLHPAPTESLNITVPLAAFTGTRDSCCGEDATLPIYEDASGPKAYANMVRAGHVEPNRRFTNWPVYVASWFKIHLQSESAASQGEDNEFFYNMIYGNNPESLCGDSIPMKDDCEALAGQ